jgi:branched-subunit amino acid aminotransferase/4-amino-4-deoxychorismate lyase
MDVWLNGHFVSREEASVSVFDAGFQHGVGLFETMGARHGSVFRVESHLQRLADSAKALLLTERLHTKPLAEAVHQVVEHTGLELARVRLTLTGGNLNMLQSKGESVVDPTILIDAQPPTPYPDAFFEQGVIVMIAEGRLNPFDPMAGHKTLNYWPRIRTLQVAAARGAGEAVWLSVTNHLACGCVSNLFLVKDGVLHTPIARGEEEPNAVPSTVLPGITRGVIAELAERKGVGLARRMLDINDLLDAEEAFLTNSSWGVLPVVGIEKESIADGNVGEMTQRLREAWLETVVTETSGKA